MPGLRREEVALLAGVSVDYYTRLERGDLSGVSDSVLDALARALQLDEAETAHLFDLARTASRSPVARKPRKETETIRPSIQRLLDSMVGALALVRNNYFDLLGANALGRALYAPPFGELSTRRERFRMLWAAHNVRYHRSGVKRLNHPVVGEMELVFDAFELPADPGLQMSTYTAEPGTSSEEKLNMLASWAATEGAGAAKRPRCA